MRYCFEKASFLFDISHKSQLPENREPIDAPVPYRRVIVRELQRGIIPFRSVRSRYTVRKFRKRDTLRHDSRVTSLSITFSVKFLYVVSRLSLGKRYVANLKLNHVQRCAHRKFNRRVDKKSSHRS